MAEARPCTFGLGTTQHIVAVQWPMVVTPDPGAPRAPMALTYQYPVIDELKLPTIGH